MKQYLVFSGDFYYPSGGWSDFDKSFDTIKEAEDFVAESPYEWWQIVALKKGWPLLKADPDNSGWGSDEFDKKMTKCVIVAACVILGCVFLDGVFDAIVYLINPDYYALQQVIKIVK